MWVPVLVRHLRHGHIAHCWVRVVNEGWAWARCTRCGRERALDDQFVNTLGRTPPPLYPSAR